MDNESGKTSFIDSMHDAKISAEKSALKRGASTAAGAMKDVAKDTIDKISQSAKKMTGTNENESMTEKLKEGISNAYEKVKPIISNAASTASEKIPPIAQNIKDKAQDMLNSETAKNLKDSAKNTWDKVAEAAKTKK